VGTGSSKTGTGGRATAYISEESLWSGDDELLFPAHPCRSAFLFSPVGVLETATRNQEFPQRYHTIRIPVYDLGDRKGDRFPKDLYTHSTQETD
jgi:hypothetical protein